MVLDLNLLFQQIESINCKVDNLQQLISNKEKEIPQRRIVDISGLVCTFPELGKKSSIYKLTSSGDIPHFKRNGKLLFDLDLIEEWAYPIQH